jgi:hypothetical protein
MSESSNDGAEVMKLFIDRLGSKDVHQAIAKATEEAGYEWEGVMPASLIIIIMKEYFGNRLVHEVLVGTKWEHMC